MLRDRTLFIVGAGASKEFDFPVGSELAAQIAKKLDIRFEGFNQPVGAGDFGLFEAIKQADGGNASLLQAACWLIRDGIELSYSIDNFIDTHRHDQRVELCGKLAIAKCILDAEKASKLHVDRNVDDTNPSLKATGTWITSLMRVMQNGVQKDQVSHFFDNSSFIVFNYDRCIEHYFYHALQALYGIAESEAAEVVATMVIHHPYGSVGALPWQGRSNLKSVLFGSRDSSRVIGPLLPNIKTYTEQTESGEDQAIISSLVEEADTVVFLGFSYLAQNLDLLLRRVNKRRLRRVIGTGIGLSTADREIVSNALSVLTIEGASSPIIEQLKCSDLISQYGRFLGR